MTCSPMRVFTFSRWCCSLSLCLSPCSLIAILDLSGFDGTFSVVIMAPAGHLIERFCQLLRWFLRRISFVLDLLGCGFRLVFRFMTQFLHFIHGLFLIIAHFAFFILDFSVYLVTAVVRR